MAFTALQKIKKNSVPTTTTSPIAADAVTIPVAELSRFRDADGVLITSGIVIGYSDTVQTRSEEITITGASGSSGAGNLTGVARGVNADGSIGIGYAWPSGTVIAVMFSTGTYNKIKDNFNECFLRDCSVNLTGTTIQRGATNSFVGLKGGSGTYDPKVELYGTTHATTHGDVFISVPNTAHSAYVNAMRIVHGDLPSLNIGTTLLMQSDPTNKYSEIWHNADDGFVGLYGGLSAYSPAMYMYGINHATDHGDIDFFVPNTAHTVALPALSMVHGDVPTIRLGARVLDRENSTAYLTLCGGRETSFDPRITARGLSYATYPGDVTVDVPNTAHGAYVQALEVVHGDNPRLVIDSRLQLGFSTIYKLVNNEVLTLSGGTVYDNPNFTLYGTSNTTFPTYAGSIGFNVADIAGDSLTEAMVMRRDDLPHINVGNLHIRAESGVKSTIWHYGTDAALSINGVNNSSSGDGVSPRIALCGITKTVDHGDIVVSSPNTAHNAAVEAMRVIHGDVPLISLYGVKFNSLSADTEALDYYEEGTFLPTIDFGGAHADQAWTSRGGCYTKLGNIVHCTGYIQLSAKGSSTGNATVSGLPFPNENVTVGSISAASLYFISVTYTGWIGGNIVNGGQVIGLGQMTEAGTTSALTHANFIDTSRVYFEVTYRGIIV